MTTAPLLPRRVISACRLVLEEIEEDRNSILLMLAAEWRRKHILYWLHGLQTIVDKILPVYLAKVAEQHRIADEAVALKLRGLAKALNEDDSRLRIEIDAEDFLVIQKHYKPEVAPI